ncbi:MAG: hypothetical protein IKU19_06515 [Clostridia bacterium]|nr:hypothetical protein [Clostridia bacterium]
MAIPFFKKETPPDTDKIHNAVDTTEQADITYTPSQIYDGIPYSALEISDTELDPGLEGIYGAMTADIASFYEEYIADAVAVVEGRVKNVRIKNYEYTTDYDKFKEGGSTRYLWDTVVYEIEVEKIYKGELGTEIFIVEDTILFDSMFYLKEGHRYVVSVIQTTEDVAYGLWQGNITEGSNKKESIYSSLYPYHPGIEITEDGYYLFPDDWTTLASSDEAVKVTMDEPFGCGTVYFKDKMMLIDSVNFEKLFEDILTKYN